MKIRKGNYKKKDGESRNVKLYVLMEKENTLEGIDLEKLSEEERKNFVKFIFEYEKVLDGYVKKAYRTFKKENFDDLTEEYLKEQEDGK